MKIICKQLVGHWIRIPAVSFIQRPVQMIEISIEKYILIDCSCLSLNYKETAMMHSAIVQIQHPNISDAMYE